jgi:hypothetical protein
MDDPVEELSSGRSPRVAPWVTLAIVVAAVLGFVAGRQDNGSPGAHVAATRAPVSSASPAPFTYLTTGINSCSAQIGRQLQLGAELENHGTTDVVLMRVKPVFPMHGLRAVESRLGTCGQPSRGPIPDYSIEPGSSVWVTVTLDVLVQCPRPLPVMLDVFYTSAGRHDHVLLGGFADLGTVPYSGCRR